MIMIFMYVLFLTAAFIDERCGDTSLTRSSSSSNSMNYNKTISTNNLAQLTEN